MAGPDQMSYTAFEGFRLIASGELALVASKTKKVIDRGEKAPVLIFADHTGEQVELDFRGTAADVLSRVSGPSEREPAETLADGSGELPRGPGRPRLGVVAGGHTLTAALELAE